MTTSKRNAQLPEVPTVAESGLPGYEAAVWYGLLGPAKMPPAVVAKLHKDFSTVLNLPDVRDVLAAATAEPHLSPTPQAFGEFLARETSKWTAVVKSSGAKED